ncbi:cyclin-G1 [Syngnathus scovelli]|uniref:cyclin-G1 n=1 Tax=Syngnathus scovelli TaxID=161590 RepID=UPI00210F85F8|nr:cyclin-G1 [Syngnathus scovelli]
MIDTVTGPGALPFAVQLKALTDLEGRYQPKLSGLRIIESVSDNGLRMTSRLRELEVKDLLTLSRFFGFGSETFSLVVSLLDRFLSVMKIQPKHLSCVGLCCFYIAVKSSEENNIPLANDLIRISQNRFTVSDMMRMEKIIMEKLNWKVKAPTALRFLRLFHSYVQEQLGADSEKKLSLERLEAQLKACHCSFVFSKMKPSLLAIALLCLEVDDQPDPEERDQLSEALESLQKLLTIRVGDLAYVRVLVGKCLAEYATAKCSRPNGQRLRWTISGRTARQLKHSYYKITHLPTIPESAC